MRGEGNRDQTKKEKVGTKTSREIQQNLFYWREGSRVSSKEKRFERESEI